MLRSVCIRMPSPSRFKKFVDRGHSNPSDEGHEPERQLGPVTKEQAQQLKMQTRGWNTTLTPHIETSKEHLPPSPAKNAPHHRAFAVGNPPMDGYKSTSPEPNGVQQSIEGQPSSDHRRMIANDEADYPTESDGDEDADGETHSVVESAPNYLVQTGNLPQAKQAIEDIKAQRIKRQRAPDEYDRPGTPDSYPQTSDGQPTREVHLPAPVHRQQALPIQRTRLPNANSSGHVNSSPQRPRSRPKTTEPQPAFPESAELGARYKFDRAVEQQAAHRRQSSLPPAPTANAENIHHHTDSPHRQHAAITTAPELHHVSHYENFHQAPSLPNNPGPAQQASHNPNTLTNPMRYSTTPHSSPPLEHQLDYDPPKLHTLTYATLHDEPFDHSPRRSTHSSSPSALSRRLHRILSNHSPEQQSQFFTTLPLSEWREAGEWFNKQFGELTAQLAQKREEQREIARRFEAEVKRREEAVQREMKTVEEEMDEMRRSGGLVLRGREGSGSVKAKGKKGL